MVESLDCLSEISTRKRKEDEETTRKKKYYSSMEHSIHIFPIIMPTQPPSHSSAATRTTTHNSTARSNRRANERAAHKQQQQQKRRNKCGRRMDGKKECFSFRVSLGIKPVLCMAKCARVEWEATTLNEKCYRLPKQKAVKTVWKYEIRAEHEERARGC